MIRAPEILVALILSLLFTSDRAQARPPNKTLEERIAEKAPDLPRPAIHYALAFMRQYGGTAYSEQDPKEQIESLTMRKDRLVIVNYDQDNFHPRLFYIDLTHPLSPQVAVQMASHGHGLPPYVNGDGVPQYFSDRMDSDLGPLGFMISGDTYHGAKSLSGKPVAEGHGRLTMALYGLEPENANVGHGRDIVMHAASYVTPDRAGRSWGCIAIEPTVAAKYIAIKNPTIPPGTLIFNYSACDPTRENQRDCYIN